MAKAMDQLLAQAEQCIIGYQIDQLQQWAGEQRFALERSALLDSEAVAEQAEILDNCLDCIRTENSDYQVPIHNILHEDAQRLHRRDEEFQQELRALGKAFAAESNDIVGKAKAKVQQTQNAFEEKEWDRLDNSLRDVMLKHAQLHHGAGVVDGFAELWVHGDFHTNLAEEKEEWAMSQSRVEQHLHAEMDAQNEREYAELEERMKVLSPDIILGQSGNAQLAEMAEVESRRLSTIETDLHNYYTSEIEEARLQCEETYRTLDRRLQEILVRTLEARVRNAAYMRKYKLAMCRWRLEYQRVYHEHCAKTFEKMESKPGWQPQQDAKSSTRHADQQRLDVVRRLVQGLWYRNKPPISEVSKFLAGVSDAAAKAGLAMPLIRVYEDELRRFGALPLVDHASRPELLECWLQAIQWDEGQGQLVFPDDSSKTTEAAVGKAASDSMKPKRP
eukprot:CAMPEP_0172911882 /NCGR_PEP_ID=MMETSP1075-20121228/187412_1 /TAXON_ID=2916 /ORGANISM="Ceratium fusus, Strain PA161109" /LENGTH=446 /DNA_ID=CAMNT_0013770273 /DNA_START=37 /DNA_END=1380 /DNA_ORIENTATION=+